MDRKSYEKPSVTKHGSLKEITLTSFSRADDAQSVEESS